MKMQTKLVLYLLSICMLIIVVGMIFYFQLKNLIEPLTPQSIPLSVEHLEDSINKNNLINNMLYQQLLNESDLESYVYTGKLSELNNFYLNENNFLQMMEKLKTIDFILWQKLSDKINKLEDVRFKIIDFYKQNKISEAQQLLDNVKYTNLIQQIKNILLNSLIDSSSSEDTVVTVKLAAKNTVTVLQNGLKTTLIIFFNAILASLILAYFSARAISAPVNLLRNNMELMSTEKNIYIPIDKKLLELKGEIGDLARSFAELVRKLRATTVLKDELLIEIERRKEIETKLQKTASDLRESNQDLDEFAYAASHDLRAPLRGIENLIKWIEEDSYESLPEESRLHFNLIKTRTQRLEALISGMLEYSRAGRMMIDIETVNVNKLIHEIIDNLSPPSHIKIVLEKDMPIFKTNKAALTQVFLNLISNAIKYNDKIRGLITIGYESMGKYYKFYVTDNGQGIDRQFFGKIFEVFQTLQSRDIIESSGIGLAIVNKIILKVGGKIWLNSVVGEGTSFYFTWPKKLISDN